MGSSTQELDQFVREALRSGATRDEVRAVLASAGWPAEQVADALDAFAEVPFAVPVPRPRPSLSAREAFLYLVLFATLYTAAFHVGSLLFDLVNRAFPDAIDAYAWRDATSSSLRWSVASVLIAYPVFLFVARHLAREVARSPVRRLSPVRRWLTYLTLFLAAGILVGDMITLLFKLLGGEISVRFLLKTLVVAAIAGTIFGYYLMDLRREERAEAGPAPRGRGGVLVAGIASVVVVATLAAAAWWVGSPMAQRAYQMDARRISDLQAITAAVDDYLQRHGAMPRDLAVLAAQPGYKLFLEDPVTRAPYTYTVREGRRYELCALFETDPALPEAAVTPYRPDDWHHGVGQHCFTREARDKRP